MTESLEMLVYHAYLKAISSVLCKAADKLQ
jgi:hypothetical protein